MKMSDVSTYEFLMKHGVDIHGDDDYLLRSACEHGHLDVVKFLLKTMRMFIIKIVTMNIQAVTIL